VTPAPARVEREHRCQRCGWYLFTSDASGGRVRNVKCGRKSCGKRQTVTLGEVTPTRATGSPFASTSSES
jgi:hypothetical protein